MNNRQLEIKNRLLVDKIVEVFRSKYDVEYYIPLKLIKVSKPMFVVDFLYLKRLISRVDSSIEIRVNGSKESRIYGKI